MSLDTQQSDKKFLRQLGIYNPNEHPFDRVTFIGVGGIGSFAALGVAKLGVPWIGLIDPDVVEEHNQPNQFYGPDDVGKAKVDALSQVLAAQAGIESDHMLAVKEKHDKVLTEYQGVVVSGLDSMQARKAVWDDVVKLNPRVPLYLDARLSGEYMLMYAPDPLNLDDCKAYEKTLHSDAEGEDVSCTARGIIDVGLMVGSIVTRAVRRHFTGQEVSKTTIMNQANLNTYTYGWD